MIYEILAVAILGSVLHFTYDWSYRNRFVGWFSAVNESTWEHIKIALSGTVIVSIFDVFWLGSNPNYLVAKAACLLTVVLLIPLLFYGYRTLIKRDTIWADILTFIITVAYSQIIFAKILGMPELGAIWNIVGGVIIVAILASYSLFTIWPPKWFLFKDPLSGAYGYEARRYRGNNKKSPN